MARRGEYAWISAAETTTLEAVPEASLEENIPQEIIEEPEELSWGACLDTFAAFEHAYESEIGRFSRNRERVLDHWMGLHGFSDYRPRLEKPGFFAAAMGDNVRKWERDHADFLENSYREYVDSTVVRYVDFVHFAFMYR